MSPQLETHDGSDQVHEQSDKQKDDGSCLASLCSAERPINAVVEDWEGAEPSTSRVADIDDAWQQKADMPQ